MKSNEPIRLSPHQEVKDKPEIAVLYHMARTGGTLLSKCIACIEGNLLLSELNPAISVGNPITQATDWFGLFSQLEKIQYARQLNYIDAIRLVQERAQKRNKKLIIRDWSHIDFTGVPFVNQCSYQFRQSQVLAPYFTIKHIATVRHPLDSFLSLSKLNIVQGQLDLNQYLQGAKQFSISACEIGFVRYEDFCLTPQKKLALICEQLNIAYNENFVDHFYSYTKLTGEVNTPQAQASLIALPPKAKISDALKKQFMDNADYWEILSLLGYAHHD